MPDPVQKIEAAPEFRKILEKAGQQALKTKNLHPWGLIALLQILHEKGERPILVLAPGFREGGQINDWLKDKIQPIVLYSTIAVPELKRAILPQVLTSQIKAQSILRNKSGIVIASVVDLVSAGFAIEPGPILRIGETISPKDLLDILIELGYERQENAVAPLDLAWRGDTLEIFEPHRQLPLRIEFFGNKIERLNFFDPINKTMQESLKEYQITFWRKDITLAQVLEEQKNPPLVVFFEPERSYEVAKGILLTEENIQRELARASRLVELLKPIEVGGLQTKEALDFHFKPAPIFSENWQKLVSFLKERHNYRILVSSRHNPKILEKFIQEEHLASENLPALEIIPQQFNSGFVNEKIKTILLTDQELFRQEETTAKTASAKTQKILLAELKIGDYVVHSEHGIGLLKSFQQITIDGIVRDYLVIEYAQGDMLYVPIEQIDKVTKFIHEGGQVKLNRLSGEVWKKAVAKVKRDTLEFAKELLKLYAKRSMASSTTYSPDDFWAEALSSTFAYEETPDQEKAIEEISRDLGGEKPMDRLLVADVGFGKTEVAIRAAMKVVSSGYQVAVLAPTTVLVEQHYKTFKSRLDPFGAKIATLSRFQTKAEQKKVIAQLKTHQLDIVIGTHRLLSRDVGFAKLGLLIIDEEQRFGVKQKEKLKEVRSQVDVLSMTATPIPRTLNLALSGIRDITVIETPPRGRIPIETNVEPTDLHKMKQAIEDEVARGGQVYFVHNRVRTIPTIKAKLERLMPEIRFVSAHGQMHERELASIMDKFYAGEYDVLVASTIIENGLDNPKVNTLIVDDANNFGLSQLHQLRGRIGRGNIQAKAYLFYKKGSLTPVMIARLKTIAEETELGSGMNIAMKDMKIRGSGGILSTRQHGHIQAIGLPMYLKLLQSAIEEIRTGTKRLVDTVTIDLPVSAYIPTTYIEQESLRIKSYQKLSLMTDSKELFPYLTELEEQFGMPPREVRNLIEIIKLKIKALRTGVIKSIRAVKATEAEGGVPGRSGEYMVTFELVNSPKIETKKLPEKSKLEEGKVRLLIDFSNTEESFKNIAAVMAAIK
jgi:transcription-repair coupling factor (superfamily II helicase)